ncbi:hypothetical protein FRB96_002469 [Tulasnella sp. 330]|nr:hypothetical protein FRB96_002469 [Tulasnella sp. 330]
MNCLPKLRHLTVVSAWDAPRGLTTVPLGFFPMAEGAMDVAGWHLSEAEVAYHKSLQGRRDTGLVSAIQVWEVENYQAKAKMARKVAENCPNLEFFEWYPLDDTIGIWIETLMWVWKIDRRNWA